MSNGIILPPSVFNFFSGMEIPNTGDIEAGFENSVFNGFSKEDDYIFGSFEVMRAAGPLQIPSWFTEEVAVRI